jgi:hypothetical protein
VAGRLEAGLSRIGSGFAARWQSRMAETFTVAMRHTAPARSCVHSFPPPMGINAERIRNDQAIMAIGSAAGLTAVAATPASAMTTFYPGQTTASAPDSAGVCGPTSCALYLLSRVYPP